MHHSLYKYYSEREWAEKFLDGELLFRSLSYFRSCEDAVRGDKNEGTAVFRPEGGLQVHNQTQGTTFTLPNHAFESAANQEEIFVFCLSRSCTERIRKEFKSVVCVEVRNIPAFCATIKVALSPKAEFFGKRVDYYKEAEGGNPRWALPDQIATSKLNSYAWQNEFRLVFSLTDAFKFENVATRLVQESVKDAPRIIEHPKYLVKARSLRDICRIHEF
jgi:hypothetical protein